MKFKPVKNPDLIKLLGLRLRTGVLLFILSSTPVWAERQTIDADVRVGFDGAVGKSGTLFPVTIAIRNRVAGTTGTIELTQPEGGGNYEVVQTLDFETPAPSIKQFTLLARQEEGRDLEVRVTFKDYLKPIQKKLNIARGNRSLVLCADVPASYRAGAPAAKYKFIGINPALLPSDSLALDGVHAVMLSGRIFAALDRSQIEALRRWVATGGILIFYDPTEDDAFRRSLAAMSGDKTIGVWVRGVEALGSGIIASSGANPDSVKALWEEDPAAMQTLFPEITEDTDRSYFRAGDFLTRLWQTQKTYGVWGFIWLILIIACYIAVIGPLDRWAVRRLGKPYLTWVLFPAAIVAFSFLAYGYSSLVNVGTMRAVRVNVADAAPGVGVARGNSTMWVYSARNATYQIGTLVEHVCFSARESVLGAGSVAEVVVVNGRQSAMSARIPIFSAKMFDASWYQPWQHRVSVRREGDIVRVTVPPELGVVWASLAQQDGMVVLSKQGAEWVGKSKATSWDEFILKAGSSLQPENWAGGFSPVGQRTESRLMPSGQALQDYLICMSFPWRPVDSGRGNDHSSPYSFRNERGEREKSLDVRNRLATGRTLLLFLDPSISLLPTRMGLIKPTTAEVNLVRIHFAEDEKGQ